GEEDAKFELILGIIRMLLLATAVLSLVVGGINIMNIMLVSVTERTREIGVRRALGASRRTILVPFLSESALVAALGGLVGVVSGLAVNRVASWGLSVWLGEWKFHIIGWSIAAGIAAAAFTGLVFGLYPAWRAARLDPAEALRFEELGVDKRNGVRLARAAGGASCRQASRSRTFAELKHAVTGVALEVG